MGVVMQEYKIYSLADDDRIRTAPMVVNCADDKEALAYAKRLLDGRVLEVWQSARMVSRLEPTVNARISNSVGKTKRRH